MARSLPKSRRGGWRVSAGLDFRPTAFKLEWMQNSEEDMESSAAYLQALVREAKPDLLHFNQFYYGSLQCDVPRLVVAHSDVLSWWSCVHQTPPRNPPGCGGTVRRWTRPWPQPLLWLRHRAGCFSRYTSFISRLPGETVVCNGRTPTLFNPNARKNGQTITNRAGLWDSGKNAALLLREPMPETSTLSGLNAILSRSSDCIRQGRHSCKCSSGAAAGCPRTIGNACPSSIYAATSRYEPFGLAPLEAALSRCAIVASDIPTFRELWGDVGHLLSEQ